MTALPKDFPKGWTSTRAQNTAKLALSNFLWQQAMRAPLDHSIDIFRATFATGMFVAVVYAFTDVPDAAAYTVFVLIGIIGYIVSSVCKEKHHRDYESFKAKCLSEFKEKNPMHAETLRL